MQSPGWTAGPCPTTESTAACTSSRRLDTGMSASDGRCDPVLLTCFQFSDKQIPYLRHMFVARVTSGLELWLFQLHYRRLKSALLGVWQFFRLSRSSHITVFRFLFIPASSLTSIILKTLKISGTLHVYPSVHSLSLKGAHWQAVVLLRLHAF